MSAHRCALFGWLLVAFSVAGCQCIGIVQTTTGETIKPGQGTQANKEIDNRGRYEISGVAMLAFYPGFSDTPVRLLDPSTGTMNGYLILYESLQQTEIAAWRLDDGQCLTSVASTTKPTEEAVIRGRDGGQGVLALVQQTTYRFERREVPATAPTPTTPPSPNIIYNFPTLPAYPFPYQQPMQFVSTGGATAPSFPAFSIEVTAPARLDVTAPVLSADGISVRRSQGLALQWTTSGAMPYVAVRLNQHDAQEGKTRSLLCRFANTGSGELPAAELAKFVADTTGASTQIYFSPTTYKLAQVPGLPKPILAVVRATTTLPVRLE